MRHIILFNEKYVSKNAPTKSYTNWAGDPEPIVWFAEYVTMVTSQLFDPGPLVQLLVESNHFDELRDENSKNAFEVFIRMVEWFYEVHCNMV